MIDIFSNDSLSGMECPVCSCDNHLVIECEIASHVPTEDPKVFKNVFSVYCEECESGFTMNEYYHVSESFLDLEIDDVQTNSNYGEGDFA